MNDIRIFDSFLLDLHTKIMVAPKNKSRIIREAIDATTCPYLKVKIKEYDLCKPFIPGVELTTSS